MILARRRGFEPPTVLRANMAGEFKVGPATLQSMYAPEFTAYSAGHRLEVAGE